MRPRASFFTWANSGDSRSIDPHFRQRIIGQPDVEEATVRPHAKELPRVPRPETAGSVTDMLGNHRVIPVLRKRQDPPLDSRRLCTIPSPNMKDFSIMVLSPERSRHR